MLEYRGVLQKVPLFRGIEEGQLSSILGCLGARARVFPKGDAVFRVGEPARYVGAVLTGGVQVCREGADGNRQILVQVPPGGLFGEAYACAQVEILPVSAWATEESAILLLDCGRIVTMCPSACTFHTRLISNLMAVLAEKNILLAGKIDHISKRTLREKLLSYLEEQAALAGGNSFTIPFDRQALADYLCVDRSALSRELGLLRREGVLEAEKSHFTINHRF